jgi:tetratricopeptide (TPR) repeat protein
VQKKLKSLILIPTIASLVLSGCFLWGSVKDGYENFTAYFNAFYNGEHAFEEAMRDVEKSSEEHDINLISGQPVSPFTISQPAHQNFDIAIEKASKVLQVYPTSNYTEDCLFIIGISYYYEGDNVRAGRKFIEEQSKYPDSRRFSEALMYYGDIEIRNRNYGDGYKDLMKAMAKAEMERNREIVAQAAADLSGYSLIQSDSVSAAVYLDSAAAFSDNDNAAIYACKAGNLLENLGNYKEAKREYEDAWNYARDIRLRFYSRYFLARAERHDRQFDAALNNLTYLRDDDKYFQYFPLIDYQKAEVWYDSGSVSTAFTEFQRIDTAYTSSEAATRSAFRVANIYLHKVGDYQSALKYYQKAAAHVTVPIISDKAREMSSNLQEYFTDLYRLQVADSLCNRVLNAASRNDSTIKHSQEEIDTLYEHVAEAQDGLGGFFLFKLQISDSSVNHYSDVVSQFPKSRVYPSALYTLGEYYFSSGDTARGRKCLTELITEHPESSFTLSASSLLGISPKISVDSSQIGYDWAVDLENRNYHDSALAILKRLSSVPKSSLTPQVLYAIGWIYENRLERPDSAFVYYKRLTTLYPTSDYGANLNSTLVTYEQAQRDSVEAKKRAADSVANAHKPAARDTVRESGTFPRQTPNTNSPDSTKGRNSPRSQKIDSIEAIREKAISDSLATGRKLLEK